MKPGRIAWSIAVLLSVPVGAGADDDVLPEPGVVHVFCRPGPNWVEHANGVEQRSQLSFEPAVKLPYEALDLAGWVTCLTGPQGGPYPNGCEAFDFDGDGDVDLADFAVLQVTLTQCEKAKLTAADAAREQHFGASVGITGDVVVVGAAGVFLGGDPGAAYVFRRYGSNWVQQQKLVPSDLQPGSSFGWKVAIDGNVAMVTAPNDSGAGAVYVFGWNGATWAQHQKLLPTDPVVAGGFGVSVAINEDVVAIGLMGDVFFGKTRPGAIYVFRWNGSSWLQEERLAPPEVGVFDRFGTSVAVSAGVIVGGAPGTGGGGAAYVFRWDGASWVQEQKLTASDRASPANFGRSVATYQNVLVVGAYSADGAFVGSGKAYVYRFNGSTWGDEQKLNPPTEVRYRSFGYSVSVLGDRLFVGATGAGTPGPASGAVYLYTLRGAEWVESLELIPSDGEASDGFGGAVSLGVDLAIVGASGTDDACSGDPFCSSGSAYIYDINVCLSGVPAASRGDFP
ncbi:MAG: hypothetical protein V1790_01285 [Planctomycetota bacterium]